MKPVRKFQPMGPVSWADDGFSYPEERHNTYLLRLGGQLPFTHSGRAGELKQRRGGPPAHLPVCRKCCSTATPHNFWTTRMVLMRTLAFC